MTESAPHRIQLSYTPNNVESFDRLKDRCIDVLKQASHATTHVPLHPYFKKRTSLEGVGHQNGTCRMGNDPGSSMLDTSIIGPYRCMLDTPPVFALDNGETVGRTTASKPAAYGPTALREYARQEL